MDNLQKIQKLRFKVLEYLYKKTEADIHQDVDYTDMINDLLENRRDFNEEDIKRAYQYLVGEGLAETKTYSSVGITHYGIKEYEAAISHPEEPTQYFPPVNVIYVENMHQSQIQQGTFQSSQSLRLSVENKSDIEDYINLLKKHLEELTLPREDESEINAEIATIEAQIRSSRPKSGIIKESLLSIKNILEGAAGSILAVELSKHLPGIIDKLS
jgi:uncharacterized LabA/DUF88 family protein